MTAKKYRVIWDLKAKMQLKEIFEYLKDNVSLETAEYVKNGIFDTTDSLKFFPEKCPPDKFLDDLPYRVRVAKKWSYRVAYEIRENEVRILLIYHSKQHRETVKKMFSSK